MRLLRGLSRLLALPLLGLIRLYQLTLSPLLGAQCRYHPSCSRYGYEAIATHGPFVGVWLAAYRVVRCNPWARGGIDPVPPRGTPWRVLLFTPHRAGTTDAAMSDSSSHSVNNIVDNARPAA